MARIIERWRWVWTLLAASGYLCALIIVSFGCAKLRASAVANGRKEGQLATSSDLCCLCYERPIYAAWTDGESTLEVCCSCLAQLRRNYGRRQKCDYCDQKGLGRRQAASGRRFCPRCYDSLSALVTRTERMGFARWLASEHRINEGR